ncbi:MAG: Hsp20/alpha crystallin family protein [Lachnospiraceae bacterium]|nr:Hsp20/alpha crystallin family protein [Lachnospiraceae bacterium]
MLRPSILTNNFMNNMFDDFFNDSYVPSDRVKRVSTMNTDIKESDAGYQIDMELPGFKKEDIKADLTDGYLTIQASHNENKEEKDDKTKYIRRERFSGCYERSFYVGDALTQEDIKAKFNDGVLTVNVPKKEAKPAVEEKKYISIDG